jgi:hypothetical protein
MPCSERVEMRGVRGSRCGCPHAILAARRVSAALDHSARRRGRQRMNCRRAACGWTPRGRSSAARGCGNTGRDMYAGRGRRRGGVSPRRTADSAAGECGARDARRQREDQWDAG